MSFLQLLAQKFLSNANKMVAQKTNLQKSAFFKKVGHFATPIPFFIGPTEFGIKMLTFGGRTNRMDFSMEA